MTLNRGNDDGSSLNHNESRVNDPLLKGGTNSSRDGQKFKTSNLYYGEESPASDNNVKSRKSLEMENGKSDECEIALRRGSAQPCKHPTSYIETLIHTLKGNIGSGMFAMGAAFKNAGLLIAPFLTVILGVICIYNNHVLLTAADFVQEKFKMRSSPTFSETVELCFKIGPKSFQKFTNIVRRMVKIFVIATQLGFCCVYLVVVSKTLRDVMLTNYEIDHTQLTYMAAIFPPILMSSLITSLKFLAPISFGSNCCLASAVFLTLYASVKDGLPSPYERDMIAPLQSLPLFVGMVIYSFEGIGLILPLKNEMKKPEQFGTKFGVLNVGLTIVCCLLVLVGSIGYLKFGDNVKESLSLNIPTNDWLGMSIQVILSIGLLFSYPLQFYVAADIIWDDVDEIFGPIKLWTLGKIITRIVLVIFTFMVAAMIPDVGLFISLVGAVCATALALVFPALIDIALRKGKYAMKTSNETFRLIMDGITLILAAFSFIVGSFISIRDITEAFFVEHPGHMAETNSTNDLVNFR